jgi:hypothetical protein
MFLPVVEPATIQRVLHFATTRMLVIHQLDVKNTFLHGDLAKCVYCHQPAGSSTHHPGSCLSAHQVPLCAKAGTCWCLVSAPRELPLQHGLHCNKLRHLLVHLQIYAIKWCISSTLKTTPLLHQHHP